MSATSSQPAIKFVTSRHLGTKWCGWFSTTPKAHFKPLISKCHFDPLLFNGPNWTIDFPQINRLFSPDVFLLLLDVKYAKLRVSFVFSSSIFRVFFVFVPFWVRIRCTSLRCLEVVDRLDSADDLSGRFDVLDDLVHALISHRRLVKSIGNDTG